MAWSQLAKDAATFLVLIVAGVLLGTYLDRRFTSDEIDQQVTSNDRPEASACIGEDGSWKHWHWANVPALSPKCRREL